MFSQEYKKGMEHVVLSREKKEEIVALMTAEPVKTASHTLRVLTVAAVLCSLLAITAAAYYMGVFEFLQEQNEYAMLGMNEVYEACARPVGASVTAENGDVFTVDRVAADGTFCTIFYCLHVQDETWRYTPRMALRSGGEDISMEGYGNSFENQEYLADDHTLYGAWRFLLREPLEEGDQVELELARYGEAEPGEPAPLLWEKALTFSVDPIQGEQFELDAVLSAQVRGKPVQVEAVSLNRSPLGTLLRLRWAEKDTNAREWYDFVLRDGDTGTYIPYDQVVINHYWDPEGYVDSVYELLKEWGWSSPAAPPEGVVFRPCPDRKEGTWLREAGELLPLGGLRGVEKVPCCGLRHEIAAHGPEAGAKLCTLVREQQAENTLFTYCASCSGQFARHGCGPVRHLLPYLLGVDEAPDCARSFLNRMKAGWFPRRKGERP